MRSGDFMPKRFAAVFFPIVLSAAVMLLGAISPAQNATLAAQSEPGAPPTISSVPKIRTVTAFVRLDRATYQAQVADALKLLHATKDALTQAGYEVETLRITTQPFPEYTRGLTAEQALQFFHDYDQLARQQDFSPDIGAAMSRDADDPQQADLLARIIAETQDINGFVTVADEQGIHWNAVRAASRAMKYLEEHTKHSEGNFHFAAGAFPPAVGAVLSGFAYLRRWAWICHRHGVRQHRAEGLCACAGRRSKHGRGATYGGAGRGGEEGGGDRAARGRRDRVALPGN
jgi:Uncharacterised ACR (DUF711)